MRLDGKRGGTSAAAGVIGDDHFARSPELGESRRSSVPAPLLSITWRSGATKRSDTMLTYDDDVHVQRPLANPVRRVRITSLNA